MTDIMKHISRRTCGFLDALPQAEKDALNAQITAEQERRKGLLSAYQVGELLGLGKDGVNNLPVQFITPFRKTSRGRRQVKCLHRNDLIAFLTSLNPTFATYDMTEGPLLTSEQAAETFGDDLPEYVQLSPRTRRYRTKATEKALAPSELIMQGFDHDQ